MLTIASRLDVMIQLGRAMADPTRSPNPNDVMSMGFLDMESGHLLDMESGGLLDSESSGFVDSG